MFREPGMNALIVWLCNGKDLNRPKLTESVEPSEILRLKVEVEHLGVLFDAHRVHTLRTRTHTHT